MEQDLRDEGAAKSQHVVHVLPSDDPRISAIVRAHVERIDTDPALEPALRLLVLVPTAEEAALLAGAVNDGLDATGALLTPVTNAARGARRVALGARAVVTAPGIAQDLLRRSALKVEGIETLVLLSLDTLVAGYEALLDEVLAEFPKDADRVASAGELTPAVEAFLERHARRARRMQYDAAPGSDAPLQYVVCDHTGRARILSHLLDTIDPQHATVVAAEEDAEAACSALAHLGYGPEDAMVAFSDGDVPEGEQLVVLYTTPADADELQLIRESGPARVVALVAPEELGAFLRVFGQSATVALPQSSVSRASSVVDGLRAAALDVLGRKATLHHQLLALAPLFESHDPAEVAAALLKLLEARPAAEAPRGSQPARAARPVREERDERPAPRPRERSERPERAERDQGERSPAASGSFTPVFLSVGVKDGAKKGDLVGALTNEAGISADMLGKITMRDMYSLVEVEASVAEQVIEAITGKVIRGRVINARVDQKPDAGDDRRGERPMRRSPGGRPSGGDERPRGRTREGGFGGGARREGGFGGARREGGFGGARREGGFGGGARREGGFGGGARREGGFSGGPRREGGGFSKRPSRDGGAFGGSRPDRDAGGERPRRPRDEAGGPRQFRDDRGSRGPRAIGESREWSDRGERLRNARRPRRDTD